MKKLQINSTVDMLRFLGFIILFLSFAICAYARISAGETERDIGRIDPHLHDLLRTASPSDILPVAFWLHCPEDLFPLRPAQAALRALTLEEIREISRARQQEITTLINDGEVDFTVFLESHGVRITHVSDTAPLVYAEVEAERIISLSRHPSVLTVYAADNENTDALNIQTCAVRAPVLWAYGITGDQINVAICEDSRIDFDNTCLWCNAGTHIPGHYNCDQHATTTAGMVISDHEIYRGCAYGACVYSANAGVYNDPELSDAIDAATENAEIQNHSWGYQTYGELNVHSRHLDYCARHFGRVACVCAHNYGNSYYVTSPGTGYNMLTVGSYYDHNTCDWNDDTISTYSGGRDPNSEHMDREKPEVAGPGEDIYCLTLANPGECPLGDVGDGTSYATPIVAGLAALLMDVDNSLILWPEVVRAIIMAGAIHNIEGNERLSELDGAGGIDAVSAYEVMRCGNYLGRTVTPEDCGRGNSLTIGTLHCGDRIRIVLQWNSNPSANYVTDPLDADFDLHLKRGGIVVDSSASYDNNYEIIDYTVSVDGTYSIEVDYRRFESTSEDVGLAWWIDRDDHAEEIHR
jgi:hypothetical protein